MSEALLWEAPMTRETNLPRLQVQESFEATRLAPQCLVAAYDRVVPIPRKTIRKVARERPQPQTARSSPSGGDHV
jgi:hypothetical protein